MPDKAPQKHRTNRVFQSLHKPLTYFGVERTLFYFVCVGAVGAFNLFSHRALGRGTLLAQGSREGKPVREVVGGPPN